MRSESCLTPRMATIRSSVSAPCTLASKTWYLQLTRRGRRVEVSYGEEMERKLG